MKVSGGLIVFSNHFGGWDKKAEQGAMDIGN